MKTTLTLTRLTTSASYFLFLETRWNLFLYPLLKLNIIFPSYLIFVRTDNVVILRSHLNLANVASVLDIEVNFAEVVLEVPPGVG